MRLALLLSLVLSSRAIAQPDGGVDDTLIVDAGTPAPPAAPVDEHEFRLLAGRLEALEEAFPEMKSVLDAMARLKFTGYIQAQYVYAENTATGVDLQGNPAVKDGFSVRRGRLKATYTGSISEYMLEVDWTGRAAELRSAEASVTEPFTGQNIQLTIGQTKWPFGHEVFQSSGDREFPERSRVIRSFFPGERDRGARLSWKRGAFGLVAGIWDGNSIQNQGFIGVDNDREKDLSARFTFDFNWIAGGVSALGGKTYDLNTGRFAPRNRLGADLQLYLSLLPFGGTALKGEWVTGHSYWSSGVERPGQAAMGWYAMVVQSIGAHEEAGIRFDYFDPAMGTAPRQSSSNPAAPASSNPIATLNVAYTHHFDELVKLVCSYEFVRTLPGPLGANDEPNDDLLNIRLQARF